MVFKQTKMLEMIKCLIKMFWLGLLIYIRIFLIRPLKTGENDRHGVDKKPFV